MNNSVLDQALMNNSVVDQALVNNPAVDRSLMNYSAVDRAQPPPMEASLLQPRRDVLRPVRQHSLRPHQAGDEVRG